MFSLGKIIFFFECLNTLSSSFYSCRCGFMSSSSQCEFPLAELKQSCPRLLLAALLMPTLTWLCSELGWGTDHVKINSAFPLFLLTLPPNNKKEKRERNVDF